MSTDDKTKTTDKSKDVGKITAEPAPAPAPSQAETRATAADEVPADDVPDIPDCKTPHCGHPYGAHQIQGSTCWGRTNNNCACTSYSRTKAEHDALVDSRQIGNAPIPGGPTLGLTQGGTAGAREDLDPIHGLDTTHALQGAPE